MTTTGNLEPDVEVLTEEQWDAAVENTLTELGFTREQLWAEKERGYWSEPAAMMAWHLIKDEVR